MKELKGIAWNHSRGFVSVVATAQRFEELNPDVRITWEKRSLQAFADASLDDLASAYDLIIMDHPHTALAAREKVLLPLDQHLSADFLADLEANSVGGSHLSYNCEGHQWTLATDAATPIATWRPDLIEKHGLSLPQSWEDVKALAKEGAVTVSLYPLDVLMHTYTFCEALGQPAFQSKEFFASDEALDFALGEFKELASYCEPECLERDPIRTAEFMSQSEDKFAAYCPFAYGYSNYSRPRYAKFPLKAGGLVTYNGKRLRSVLGGAGLAVLAKTKFVEEASKYAEFTASSEVQAGIYYENGGQPGYRGAWLDDAVNDSCMDFFKDTLESLDEALLRPAYPGYVYFQDTATPVIKRFLSDELDLSATKKELNSIYIESLNK